MRASEVMIADPIVVAAGATSSEVAALMRVRNISDRDVVTECVGQGHDPSDCSVQDHARTDTPVVKPETELKGYKVPKQSDHHHRTTIVVVDGDMRVVGFIPHPEEVQGIV